MSVRSPSEPKQTYLDSDIGTQELFSILDSDSKGQGRVGVGARVAVRVRIC